MGLRLQRLELENFANLYTGLGVHRLEIDFTRQTNTVCVIIGENGRGKTSLLSYMTPFAGLGNIDPRDNESLIIQGEKGYKRIVYSEDSGKTIYDIKHFMIPAKDRYTVKSYISVNEEELNENGNVTSFKKIIYDLLGIEPDFLKLVRIGDNVSNLISAKATERKVFMAKILDEVDMYLKSYKKMSQKASEVKAVLGHITDEIAKTGITDANVAEETLAKTRDLEAKLQKKLDNANDAKSKAEYEIELIEFPSDGEHVIKKLENTITKYENALGEITSGETSETVSARINALNIDVAKLEVSVTHYTEKFETALNDIDATANKLHDTTIELEKEESELNLSTMREHVASLRKAMNESYETRFDEVKVSITKEEFDTFVMFLKNIQLLLNGVYEFGKGPIREVLSGMRDNVDILGTIRSNLINLEARNRAEKMSILDRLIDTYSRKEYNCTDDVCPYKELHKELLLIKDSTPLENATKDEAFYQSMKAVYDNVNAIIGMIKEKKDVIIRLPDTLQEIFETDSMFRKMSELKPVYSEEEIDAWRNYLTDKQNYDKLVADYNEQQLVLERLEKTSKEGYLKKQIKEDTRHLDELRTSRDMILEELNGAKSQLVSTRELVEHLQIQLEALTEYESTKDELNVMRDKSERYGKAVALKLEHTIEVQELETQLSKTRNEIGILSSAIERYNQLQSELSSYSNLMEVYENLRYALSNRTGLPLFYINLYLRDTQSIANELLDIVYEGKVYLSDFVITEDSFKMPYVKNEIEIPDVSYASQGEKSFFNMAISSALRAQCMERYNIALFDEVDGVFDDKNRQKTIPVLEKQLEISNIEQAFLITHNQMFNQYPVDVINLDCLENSTVQILWS